MIVALYIIIFIIGLICGALIDFVIKRNKKFGVLYITEKNDKLYYTIDIENLESISKYKSVSLRICNKK